jgi:hypothetical protein
MRARARASTLLATRWSPAIGDRSGRAAAGSVTDCTSCSAVPSLGRIASAAKTTRQSWPADAGRAAASRRDSSRQRQGRPSLTRRLGWSLAGCALPATDVGREGRRCGSWTTCQMLRRASLDSGGVALLHRRPPGGRRQSHASWPSPHLGRLDTRWARGPPPWARVNRTRADGGRPTPSQATWTVHGSTAAWTVPQG